MMSLSLSQRTVISYHGISVDIPSCQWRQEYHDTVFGHRTCIFSFCSFLKLRHTSCWCAHSVVEAEKEGENEREKEGENDKEGERKREKMTAPESILCEVTEKEAA